MFSSIPSRLTASVTHSFKSDSKGSGEFGSKTLSKFQDLSGTMDKTEAAKNKAANLIRS